jgi:3-oxoadipate enol-lactonase
LRVHSRRFLVPSVTVNSISLAYRIDGDADSPWLILSNGLGLDLNMWAPQMAVLAQRFHVLRYDSRGHGESAAPDEPTTIDTLGRDVIGLMDALDIERADFCGFSMGGMIGQWLGIHAPHRIDHLVLAHTAARIGPVSMWNERIALVEAQGMAAISDAAMRRWFTPGFMASQPDLVRKLKATMERNDPRGYVRCCAAIRDADFRDALGSIAVPTLVLSGAHDAATTPADGAFLARYVRGAEHVEIDGAHLSNFEKPEAFTAALAGFLDPPLRAGEASTPVERAT